MGKKESLVTDRVKRLVAEGKRPIGDPAKYVQELGELAEKIVDDRLIKMESRVFKALSAPSRLKILKLLGTRGMCVCEIMTALKMTQPTASHHLNILENAGLVDERREGKWVFYRLVKVEVIKLLQEVEAFSTR